MTTTKTKSKTTSPDILTQIEKAGLVGRGGAAFPTARKWQLVKQATGQPKYVICNASEGEIGLFKDIYILEHHTEEVFEGMRLAMDFLETHCAYFNMNAHYYRKLHEKLSELIKAYAKEGYEIRVFREHPSYIGGEETALLNAIEGKRPKPRLKPPYPSDSGLFGKPTLVHNVETLYNISRVAAGTYTDSRFYCLSGPVRYPGVYELPADLSLQQLLEETNNLPDFPFFAQIGGSASGAVFNSDQLKDEKMSGAGSLEVYPLSTPPREMLLKWFKFYSRESCGKCTPCRDGNYQLLQLTEANKEIPWKEIGEILDLLESASFCALGKSVPVAVKSYCRNVLKREI